MGAFVLGVLVGWLAEWLFYTFWVKAGDGDECSKIKAELELKNRQISSLQSQLASATEGTQSKSNSSDNIQSAVSTTSHASTNNASTTSSSSATKQSATQPSNAKASGKTTTKSPAKAKTSNAATKTTTKPTVNKTKTQVTVKAGGDDFTKLTGIGPSMSATLKSLGVDTFEKLAATDDDNLRDMLEASGARMNNNKEAMDSWNEQATVAATGDFKALKAMQAALKS